MARILGIDPGSRCTGYGIIEKVKQNFIWVTHGQIQTSENEASAAKRLYQIFQNLSVIISQFKPEQVAIEQVFVYKNVQSALKLGQARGAAIVATAHNNLKMAEYSPRQIKQAVVGYGAATKQQVQVMVRALLNITQEIPSDAADALAIALCHGQAMHVLNRLANAYVTAGKIT